MSKESSPGEWTAGAVLGLPCLPVSDALPALSGALRLDDSTLTVAFQDLPAQAAPSTLPPVRLDVGLITGDNVWMRLPQVRLKLDGSLNATHTLAAPVVSGAS